jgi:hypothetical protein
MGQAWEPSKQQCSLGNRAALDGEAPLSLASKASLSVRMKEIMDLLNGFSRNLMSASFNESFFCC